MRRRSRNRNGNNRIIANQFLEYLRERGLIKTWFRPHLAQHYANFKQNTQVRLSFSSTLFALANQNPRELRVRRGTTIYFHGTDDWSKRSATFDQPEDKDEEEEFIPKNRRIPKSMKKDWKMDSEGITIYATGEKTVETVPGHYLCRFSGPHFEDAVIELEVKNESNCDLVFRECNALSKAKDFKVTYEKNTLIPPNLTQNIQVNSLHEGEVCTTEIELLFEKDGQLIPLLRYLKFKKYLDGDNLSECDDEEVKESTKTKPRMALNNVMPGVRPDSLNRSQLKMSIPLPNNPVPAELKKDIKRGIYKKGKINLDAEDSKKVQDLQRTLDIYNYNGKFSLLLHIEELCHENDIKRYDICPAILKRKSKNSQLLYLAVPGLAEKRPSVLRGDRVHAIPLTQNDQLTTTTYEGYVHHVENEEVGLGFDRSMPHIAKMKYYIRFTFNRLPLKLMHRATSLIMSEPNVEELLFPKIPPDNHEIQTSLTMLNRDIENNEQQRKAVHNIALGNISPIYIIYGPPGTGKTITMVEAIQQSLLVTSGAHFLVCAPSNSACDLITSRLLEHIDKHRILRMHAASRYWGEVPDDVRAVSNYDDHFVYPSVDTLCEYSVIVTTLITAGRIASAKFPLNHFDRVFIDESGQAMEPECLVALARILKRDGNVILAGDPKQLGPIVRSPIANSNGLQISFLERLMETCPVYKRTDDVFHSSCITKLLKNYRSHECIIKVSNEKFYENELEVHADLMMRTSLCAWEELPTRDFPVVFHGVQGEDKKEPQSPSYFNPHEVAIVLDYVSKLLDIRGNKVRPKEIGIITPYRRQVQKIREKIRKIKNGEEIKVGSVEEFQGQERRVIIISTVRSNTSHLQFDRKFNLGFLINPKRFNVAVTRTKALLVIVGNPRVLCLDECWRQLLQYCIENNAMKGMRFTQRDIDREVDECKDLMEEIKKYGYEDNSAFDDQADPEWRRNP